MDFGKAIVEIKEGCKVQRKGWNGKNMFLYYVPAASYPASNNKLGIMKGAFEDDLVPYQAYIAMKTADNTVVPWLASQTDILAEDWQVISKPDVATITISGPTQCGKSIVMDFIARALEKEYGITVVSEDLESVRNSEDFTDLDEWQVKMVKDTTWHLKENGN